VLIRIPELWPNDWILHNGNAPALTQKSITDIEYPLYPPDLAVSKNKVCLQGTKISGY